MKTFYTERDIEDMHAAGVTEIEIDDDVVLTDLAREKAIGLGVQMKRVEKRGSRPEAMPRVAGAPAVKTSSENGSTSSTAPAAASSVSAEGVDAKLVSQVKSAVIARLGTTEYNGLLDKIIPQVLARLNVQSNSGQDPASSASSQSDY